MKQKINYDYFRLINELPLLLATSFIKSKNKKNIQDKKILIANSCIIGDFATSLTSIIKFIKKNKDYKIDLIVSPQIKPLAEKIKGINKVFVVKSVYCRNAEKCKIQKQNFDKYKKLIVIRMGKDSYSLIKSLDFETIETSFPSLSKYYLHLAKNLFSKKIPKQMREINFEILEQKADILEFEEMFSFNEKDYKKINDLEELKTKDKIIIIHTSAPWIMKKWDNEKWAELLKKINSYGKYRFIFVGGSDEEKDYKKISKSLDFKVYSLINKIDLAELILIMKKSDYFIGIDSGPRNMADLADLRSITLIGSGLNIFMPWNKKDIVIEKSSLTKWYQTLFYTKKNNMNLINSEEVFEAFKKLIKKN